MHDPPEHVVPSNAPFAFLLLPDPLPAGPLEVKLSPFTPKALYLSFYGVGSKALRGPAMKLIEETELNALVIDVKGDRGMIPYRSSVPLATEVGGQKIITVRDAEGLMASFKAFSQWFGIERQASLNAAVMAAGGLGAQTRRAPEAQLQGR